MTRRPLLIAAASLTIGIILGGLWNSRAVAQGPGFRRYEYNCQPGIERPWKPDGAMKLNTMGAQGWELVMQLPSNSDVFCFRRSLY